MKHKLFKVNQNAVIKNQNDEFLIVKNSDGWSLPGGRLEKDNTPQEGLLREIKEEIGIENLKIQKVLFLDLSKSKETYRVTFLCTTPETSVVLSKEHTEYAWVNKNNIEDYNFEFENTKNILGLGF